MSQNKQIAQRNLEVVPDKDDYQQVVETLRKTFGPRNLTKWSTLTNGILIEGNVITVESEAAKTILKYAKDQFDKFGDGKTSVFLLADEMLKNVVPHIGDDPIHVVEIVNEIKGMCLSQIKKSAQEIPSKIPNGILESSVETALFGQFFGLKKKVYTSLVVDSVFRLDSSFPINMIGITCVVDGNLEDSVVVDGLAIKTRNAFGLMKRHEKCKIAFLQINLQLATEYINQVAIPIETDADADYKRLIEALDKICESGANVVLSTLHIGNTAQQYFANRNIFCEDRVPEEDLKRTMKACGGVVKTTTNDLENIILGNCKLFEERQIGRERFIIFEDCINIKTCTMILYGCYNANFQQTEASLRHGLTIARCVRSGGAVAGGGAIEMELSNSLRREMINFNDHKSDQLLFEGIADALEIIPRQLCANAKFSPETEKKMWNNLRKDHATKKTMTGVNLNSRFEKSLILEPALIKKGSLNAAFEAVEQILLEKSYTKNEPEGGKAAPTQSLPKSTSQQRPSSHLRTFMNWFGMLILVCALFGIPAICKEFIPGPISFLEAPMSFVASFFTFFTIAFGIKAAISGNLKMLLSALVVVLLNVKQLSS